MDSLQAADWLHAAEGARQRARESRRAFWIPLVIFGVIVLLASPLYRFSPGPSASARGLEFVRARGFLTWFAGGSLLRDPELVSLFWLVSLPIGYGLTVLFYRYRSMHRGIATRVWPYVATGVGLLVFLIAASAIGHARPGDLFIRGLAPLLTISLGLFVLAWVERSFPLAGFAVGFLGLTLLVNFYDIENLFGRVGVDVPAPAISVILPGVALLLAGALFGIVSGRRR